MAQMRRGLMKEESTAEMKILEVKAGIGTGTILQYWFRGVEKFAPWVNRIYFVTWGHIPSWLNLSHPKLKVVRHEEFIPTDYLPTFSSHPIELNLHRIKGLSERFVYFNDDTFLIRPVLQEDFFQKRTAQGLLY